MTETAGYNVTQTDPPFSILYAPSGYGKSTALLYAYPNAFWIAPRGGIKPASFVGYKPPLRDEGRELQTLDDIIEALPRIAQTGADGIVIDDFSYVAEITKLYYQRTRKLTNYKLWSAILDTMLILRHTSRDLGLHVAVDAHEAEPTTRDGEFLKGSPDIPGSSRKKFPVACDLVARVVHEPTLAGVAPEGIPQWPFAIYVNPDDPQWYTKDRDSVVRGRVQLNLGEVLRAAGYKMSRAPGMEWQDEIAEVIAEALMQGADRATIFQEANSLMRSKYLKDATREQAFCFMRWTWYDGTARAALRRNKERQMAAFGL